MIVIENYINSFSTYFKQNKQPWEITNQLPEIIIELIKNCNADFKIDNNIAVHKTAVIEAGATVKSPAIIGANCFISANAYLRGGVFLAAAVKIGTGCEIKSSIIFNETAIAHFNFIGNRQVYYFHQITAPVSSLRPIGNFWIKGLSNGYGGFLNLAYEFDVFSLTTCIQRKNIMISVIDTL